jgi:hypothetical protein
VPHAARGGDVGLAQDLRGGLALRRVGQHGRDRVALHRRAGARAIDDLQADALEAVHQLVLGLVEELSRHAPTEVERLGAHRRHADHARRHPGRRLHVAADAVRVLAVELALGRHRAEHHHEPADLVVAPPREALLLLHGLVVAQRVAAHADRQARGEQVLHVDVARDRVAGLVDRRCAALLVDVCHADGRAGLDRGHRLDDVGAVEVAAPVGVRVRQRHRADLLDHRRRVAVRHAGELVAALGPVELRIVVDLVEVEVEDVLAVVLRGRAEPDVAAHAAGAHERRVEGVDRHVRGADEVDLLLARARRLQPQSHPSDLARDEVRRVQEGVDAVRDELAEERRLVDAVHLHEQLVEGELAAHAAHAREHVAGDVVAHRRERRREHVRARLRARGEQPVAPVAALDDDVARARERAPRPVERGLLEAGAADRLEPVAALERLAAHADRVDLVDEHHALPAPLAREPAGLADQEHHDDDVHADERLREPGAGHRDDRRVERRRDRLGEHRLAGARRADEEQAAFGLAAGGAELLARRPQLDDLLGLLLGLGLAAHVVELDAPVRVARLVALHLLQAEEQQRPEQDHQVDEEQERELDAQPQQQRQRRDQRVDDLVDRDAEDRHRGQHDGRGQREPGQVAEPRTPVPHAAPRDDVRLDQLAARAVQARARDQAVREDVHEPAEGDDERDRGEQRPQQRPVVLHVEECERHGAREQRDERGGAREAAPFAL